MMFKFMKHVYTLCMYEIIKNEKYFYISAIIMLIITQLIGNDTVYSYCIAGVWLGFWTGVKYTKQKIEKKMNKSEDENDFYKKMEEYL
jgi:hypothetical protein